MHQVEGTGNMGVAVVTEQVMLDGEEVNEIALACLASALCEVYCEELHFCSSFYSSVRAVYCM